MSTFIIFSNFRTSLKVIFPSLFLSAFWNQSQTHLRRCWGKCQLGTLNNNSNLKSIIFPAGNCSKNQRSVGKVSSSNTLMGRATLVWPDLFCFVVYWQSNIWGKTAQKTRYPPHHAWLHFQCHKCCVYLLIEKDHLHLCSVIFYLYHSTCLPVEQL